MRIPLVDLARQHDQIKNDVVAGLNRVMADASFILGEDVALFEREFAMFCGVGHCVGVGNGTDALELSVRALGLGPGDQVILPANSFIASALGVIRAGVDVVLVDCDPDTFLIDVESISGRLGPRVGAIMPVHLYGQMAPVELITEIADGIPILEDAAQSQGATRHGARAGSVGTVAATSFYPGKNIGAYGDGGGVLTNDEELAERVRNLRNWGSPRKYHHPVIGFNSRLDTIQAVVLRAKLEKLSEWNKQRRLAAELYDELLQEAEQIVTPTTLEANEHVWHLYVVRTPDRDRVVAALNAVGIGAGVHYPTPMHLQGALAHLGHSPGDFPNAETTAQEILSLPLFPGITESEQEYVADTLLKTVGRPGR
jgi:dTDP-4-amino-4,6-dideoxygalactose transaminase